MTSGDVRGRYTPTCPHCGREIMRCEVRGCEEPAEWEGWCNVMDIAGLPSGMMRKISVCNEHRKCLRGYKEPPCSG